MRGRIPDGETEFQHVNEGWIVEEVVPVPPVCDVDVVGHWLASHSRPSGRERAAFIQWCRVAPVAVVAVVQIHY